MLSKLAVLRHQFTLVVFVALAALGLVSLKAIPKAEDPTFPTAYFSVVTVLPGATPAYLERTVVEPVEVKLKALADVKSLQSEIRDGIAIVGIEFVAGADVDRKRDDVLRETTGIRPALPAEIVRFEVSQYKTSQVNIAEVALVSDLPYSALRPYVQSLKRGLENVAGVDKVELSGLPDQELSVTLDSERLVTLGLSPLSVVASVAEQSHGFPAGSVDLGTRRFNVKTIGSYETVDQVGETVVRTRGGEVVRVRDVASVGLSDASTGTAARYDGKRAVLIAVSQREGENLFTVQANLDSELAKFERELPRAVQLKRGFVQANNVTHRLSGFGRDFALAILLVLVTLMPLGLRASAVVMVSIPLSLLIGLTLLRAVGCSINQLSIVGFVIALGLLVDDAVVVVENIVRWIRKGQGVREAAIGATNEITGSVLGCTSTLILSFVPLLFLPGASGQFIRSLPLAVIFTVLASLGVSLTIVPFIASRALKSQRSEGNFASRAMTWLIEGSYRHVLAWSLKRPKTSVAGATVLFLASLALLPQIGFSLFPKAGTPQFIIAIEGPDGATFAETDRAARFVESVLVRHPEVGQIATSIGKGNPQIYYNIMPSSERANVAEIFAEMKTRDVHANAKCFDAIRLELRTYPDARIVLKEFENGPPVEAPIAIRVLGDNATALSLAASQVESVLRGVDGTRDTYNPERSRKVDFSLDIDQDKAAQYEVVVSEIERAVRLALGGIVAGRYVQGSGDEPNNIRVSLAHGGDTFGSSARLEVLERVHVTSAAGQLIPLRQFARVVPEDSPTTLRHFNRQRSTTVIANVRSGYNTQQVTETAVRRLRDLTLPPNVSLSVAGELESRQESVGGMGSAILIASFGILAVLILEFRTFRSTAIVASVIPLGIIGGLLALFLTGNTLSFTASIGFVALMGIEVKNSILLVDFANQLRSRGVGIDDAIQRAGEIRFLPILLTTLTAMGGLVPLAAEDSALYSPLAWVLLGGLVTSTVLTRVVTPAVYKLLAPKLQVA